MKKTLICSICYNRPEMFKISAESIMACRDKENVDWVAFVDSTIDHSGFGDYELFYREQHLGLSKNVLMALKYGFDKGYDIVTIIEDDVVVSKDFIEYIKMCMKLKEEDIFSVSGWSRAGNSEG